MDPPATAAPPPPQQRQRRGRGTTFLIQRTLIITICFVILSLLMLEPLARNSVKGDHKHEIDLPSNLRSTPSLQVQTKTIAFKHLTSGVGLVTTDGQWDISPDVSANYDVKILGFTDSTYLPIAKVWYDRLTKLGYNEHYIGAHDKAAYDNLIRQNYRVLPCFIDSPQLGKRGECCITNICSLVVHHVVC
jgi:hypothetical protein